MVQYIAVRILIGIMFIMIAIIVGGAINTIYVNMLKVAISWKRILLWIMYVLLFFMLITIFFGIGHFVIELFNIPVVYS